MFETFLDKDFAWTKNFQILVLIADVFSLFVPDESLNVNTADILESKDNHLRS